MKSTFISKEKNEVKFKMEFTAEEFENAIVKVYQKEKEKFEIDGFRKGKAPRSLIEKRYGETIFFDEAINNLENFDGNDKILAPKAMQTLALCYAHKENLDKAISLLIDAAETAQNTAISPRCLMDAAAMYEQQGNSKEAKKLYEQIKKEYPNSPEAGNIDKFINSIN